MKPPMKKRLPALLLALALLPVLLPAVTARGAEGESATLPYTDVTRGAWYYDAVAFVHQKGLMNGVGNDLFQPNGTVTRQQVWMVLARLSGRSPAGMDEARQWAMDNGVSDGTAPEDAVTREQLVTLLYRFGRHSGGSQSDLVPFRDWGSISKYALEPFAWAVEGGIVGGTSEGTLSPQDTATRAQFAVILQRYVQALPTG